MEIAGCVAPDDRLYDLEHEVWWKDGPDGIARVGVMATFGAFAGPFRELVFRPVSGRIQRGRSVATVESVRLTGAVRIPVDSELVEQNAEVARRPRLLNDAPYTDGWVAKVRPVRSEDPGAILETLPAIRSRLEESIRSRRIRCWPKTPEIELIEVGIECAAVLVRLNEAVARSGPGEAVLLVTDDPTSPIEMVRWSDQTGLPVLAHRLEDGLHQFLIENVAEPVPRRPRR
jgi:glycine cleavage system H lipoate-binding protein/TusA-related sulfurtransferase